MLLRPEGNTSKIYIFFKGLKEKIGMYLVLRDDILMGDVL